MKLIIILATFNGVRFIEDQIRSIQTQAFKDWSLLIRDDGSTDDTIEEIRACAQTDQRISLLQDGLGNLGVIRNFAQLMQEALDRGADYVAISDQDDVWHPEKLQILLDEMKKTEAMCEAGTSVLVHSDLEVVDEHMRTIHTSFMDCRKISPFSPRLEALLCQNIVTGCTCLINGALLNLALPVPQGILMHDWWLALLALSCGNIGYVQRPLVRYRQHRNNVIGVKSRLTRIINFLSMKDSQSGKSGAQYASDTIRQARLLSERLQSTDMGKQQRFVIERYQNLVNQSRFERLCVLMSFTTVRRSILSDLLFKFTLLSLPSGSNNER